MWLGIFLLHYHILSFLPFLLANLVIGGLIFIKLEHELGENWSVIRCFYEVVGVIVKLFKNSLIRSVYYSISPSRWTFFTVIVSVFLNFECWGKIDVALAVTVAYSFDFSLLIKLICGVKYFVLVIFHKFLNHCLTRSVNPVIKIPKPNDWVKMVHRYLRLTA